MTAKTCPKCGAAPVMHPTVVDYVMYYECDSQPPDENQPHFVEGGACLTRQRDRGDLRIAELVDKVNDLTRRNALLRAAETKEFWAWQGDGEDHLESLVTPVLIHAKELRRIIEQRDALERRVRELEDVMQRLVVELDAYLRPWNQPQKDPTNKAARLDSAENAARFVMTKAKGPK